MSTIAVFLILGGGAAIAAKNALPKKSVGARQLKRNSVTTAKLRKNAVSTGKIRNAAVTAEKLRDGSVNGAKVADGSIGGAEIDPASTPFGRKVYEARGNASTPVGDNFILYPLGNPTYVQDADRDDVYMGALDITFLPSCEPPRGASAYILVDTKDPNNPTEDEVVSYGRIEEEGGGVSKRRINIGPYIGGVRFEPGAPTAHTLQLYVEADCKESSTGATASFGAVDVIGIK
jgi:hypothetical protein